MQVILIGPDKQQILDIMPDETILSALQRYSIPVAAPCGGKGTCGKCRVSVDGLGMILSCQMHLSPEVWRQAGLTSDKPLVVRLPEPVQAQISTDGLLPAMTLNPLVYKGRAEMPEPSLTDQRPDDQRFYDAAGKTIPYSLLPQLPAVMRKSGYKPSYYFRRDTGAIVAFTHENRPEPLGMAIDIGTTTLAAYLCDLGQGIRLASASMLNPQSIFGADVISRIEQAAGGQQKALRQTIVRAIGDLAGRLIDKACRKTGFNYQREDIAHLVLAGNTTMIHLLAGFPADAIARSPFIPVSLQALTLTAADLELSLNPHAVCQLLPSIAGYVGADITAGILACGLNHLNDDGGKRASLLLDIGTNGEIVLSGPQGMIACSTAAGPAFEGANITCGMGGVQGAIDQVALTGDDLTWTLIGSDLDKDNPSDSQTLARGLCGSGLVAALAVLLEAGLVDETGRITDEPETLPPLLGKRVCQIDGQAAVILAEAAKSAAGEPIYLSQKDIREVQNAKAAIAAGIALLIEQAGLRPEQIDQVFIAGGFGNYLDVRHAFRIGLLPEALNGRTRAVGNTAGMGALYCLLDQDALKEASAAAEQVTYYELSADRRFTDLYIEAMLFPEGNL
ncbi:MAG: ASKHA domain-containing protein [Clostridiaceae bacterium]|nr:ASKHA domain-containing protein [Clostridiaceae bacterium]